MTDRESNLLLDLLDGVAEWTGRLVAWFTLAMVLIYFAVVVMRYAFDLGSIQLQESVIYLHACAFLLGSAYTLRHNAHVRVDLVYRRLGLRGKAVVDFFGTAFLLLPVSAFVLWASWDYVAAAWAVHETSAETGGLPWVYWLKTAMPAFAVLMLIQGVSELIRNALIVLGRIAPPAESAPNEL